MHQLRASHRPSQRRWWPRPSPWAGGWLQHGAGHEPALLLHSPRPAGALALQRARTPPSRQPQRSPRRWRATAARPESYSEKKTNLMLRVQTSPTQRCGVCWLYARRERRYTRRCTPQSEFLLQKNTCTEQTSSHNSLSPQTEIRACCTRDAAGPYPTPTLHAQGRWTVYTQPTPGASPLCHAPRARSLRHGPPQRARHMSVIT